MSSYPYKYVDNEVTQAPPTFASMFMSVCAKPHPGRGDKLLGAGTRIATWHDFSVLCSVSGTLQHQNTDWAVLLSRSSPRWLSSRVRLPGPSPSACHAPVLLMTSVITVPPRGGFVPLIIDGEDVACDAEDEYSLPDSHDAGTGPKTVFHSASPRTAARAVDSAAAAFPDWSRTTVQRRRAMFNKLAQVGDLRACTRKDETNGADARPWAARS